MWEGRGPGGWRWSVYTLVNTSCILPDTIEILAVHYLYTVYHNLIEPADLSEIPGLLVEAGLRLWVLAEGTSWHLQQAMAINTSSPDCSLHCLYAYVTVLWVTSHARLMAAMVASLCSCSAYHIKDMYKNNVCMLNLMTKENGMTQGQKALSSHEGG